MKIPTKVKIGGTDYRVAILDDWFERGDSEGECFNDKKQGNTICIYSKLTPERKEATFIHECLHCMNSEINHEFLDSLAEQIYQLLKDNDLLKE